MPYIGRSTDGFGVRNRFLYLASASDTSVSGADANGATLTFTDGAYVDVYLNGVLLKAGTDYNTNTANTIAGLSALAANDEVTVIVYDVFTVGDMVSATSGGTFTGNVTHNGTVTFGSTVSGLDVNGTEVILDADGDTTITADTDDQIDIKIGGTDEVTLSSSGIVINEGSNDRDFRVESNGNTHMLFVDGGNDGVGIGTSSVDTASTLTVSNTSDAHGITIVGAVNKSRMQFQGANTGSGTTDGLIIGLSSSDDTNDDSALIGLKESGSMTFQTNNTNHLIIDGNGHVTKPLNSAFHVTGTTQNNINHNTDFYPQKGSGSVIYDVNSDISLSDNVSFSPADVHYFTAPVTGKYMFEFRARFDNMTSDITYIASTLVTSNRSHGINMHSTNWMDATATYYSHQGTIIADLDANDSAYVTLYLAGGTTGTDLNSHSFKGILIG